MHPREEEQGMSCEAAQAQWLRCVVFALDMDDAATLKQTLDVSEAVWAGDAGGKGDDGAGITNGGNGGAGGCSGELRDV